MKYMKVKEKYGMMNLQIFAGEEGEGGDDSGEGDDQDDDQDDDSDDNGEERKFTQKDVDAAVEKRLARERRKWNKQQSKGKDGEDTEKDDKEGSEDSKVKAAEDRARKAEEKNACYEAGVSKDSVEDVAALAHAYMEKDEELDLEDAIEKVLKKYPHFKTGAKESGDEDETKGKSWGQRQNGKSSRKMTDVEKRFYELNPDLKE